MPAFSNSISEEHARSPFLLFWQCVGRKENFLSLFIISFFVFSPWSKIVCYYIDCLLYFYTVVFLLVDQSQRGSLFTLFLYNPLMGFLSVCGLSSMRYGLWEKAQELLRKFFHDIGQMITSSRVIGNANLCVIPCIFIFFYAFINFYTSVTAWTNGQILYIFHTFSVDCLPDQAYLQFYGDEFLRLLMIRFVFCCTTLRLHKLFRVRLNWINIIYITIINTIWFIIISEKYLSHLSIFVIFVSWTWY